MDASPYTAVTRLWNSAEWQFKLDFHRRYIQIIGHEEWEIEQHNHHWVMMHLFDDMTNSLDCTYASNGMTEIDKSARRELCVSLSIQHFSFIKQVQDFDFERRFNEGK